MFKQRERTRDREEGLVLMVREEKGERKSTKKQSGKKDKIDNNSRIYRWKKGGLCLPKEDGGKNLIRGFLFFSLIQTDATDTVEVVKYKPINHTVL